MKFWDTTICEMSGDLGTMLKIRISLTGYLHENYMRHFTRIRAWKYFYMLGIRRTIHKMHWKMIPVKLAEILIHDAFYSMLTFSCCEERKFLIFITIHYFYISLFLIVLNYKLCAIFLLWTYKFSFKMYESTD